MALVSLPAGSSPRMRGAPLRGASNLIGMGIIPADAGSTARSARACHEAQDHPRGCGEHDLRMHQGQMKAGSSPRMRGAHHITGPIDGNVRIIPADAGSTTGLISGDNGPLDHPRGCGEH